MGLAPILNFNIDSIVGLEFDESTPSEQAPPLWKDLTVASAVAVLLWAAAAIVFG